MGMLLNKQSAVRVALVLVAMLLFIDTLGFRQFTEGFFGPATWPQAVLILLAASAAVDTLRSRSAESQAQDSIYLAINWKRVAYFAGCLSCYVLGMEVVGFPLATFIFCFACLVFHRIVNWKINLFVALSVTIVTIIVFLRILYLALPRGMWIFYDVTNFLLSFIGR